jgi:hypothetical protein
MTKRIISFNLDVDVISWLDENAKKLNMSRTAYLEFLFTQAKPLMEQIGPALDSVLEKVVKAKKLEVKSTK